MALRLPLIVSTCLFAGAVLAQTTAPQARLPPRSDDWNNTPAKASSTADTGASSTRQGSEGRFKFKESASHRPMRNQALEQSGKAPVMGGNELGRDGRPTVSCVNTPQDPACR